MGLRELSYELDKVSQLYARQYNIERDDDWFVFKIQEELGEMVQKYLMLTKRAKQKNKTTQAIKEEFEEEVSDVLCHVLLLTKHMNIDIENVIQKKWFAYLEKNE